MKLEKFLLAATAAAVLVFSGCSVEQTKEAKLPDVNVQATEGQMPEYDVDTAEVEVTTEKKDVKVPDVDVSTETKKVDVPDVDVTMPKDK